MVIYACRCFIRLATDVGLEGILSTYQKYSHSFVILMNGASRQCVRPPLIVLHSIRSVITQAIVFSAKWMLILNVKYLFDYVQMHRKWQKNKKQNQIDAASSSTFPQTHIFAKYFLLVLLQSFLHSLASCLFFWFKFFQACKENSNPKMVARAT